MNRVLVRPYKKPMADLIALKEVLTEVRALVQREDNDFAWSGWESAEEALQEIDSALATLEEGRPPGVYLKVLFLPTGPLQELSLSSGWGDEFVALANRFDEAFEGM